MDLPCIPGGENLIRDEICRRSPLDANLNRVPAVYRNLLIFNEL